MDGDPDGYQSAATGFVSMLKRERLFACRWLAGLMNLGDMIAAAVLQLRPG